METKQLKKVCVEAFKMKNEHFNHWMFSDFSTSTIRVG